MTPGAARGQALTEFIVLTLALIPLFLLMPMIAKYQDIAHVTQLASRYVAFDAMSRNDGMSDWTPVGQLAGETRRRYFSNTDAPVKTGDVAGNFKANQNLFWSDRRGAPLIGNFERDIVVNFGPDQGADHDAAYSDAPHTTPLNLASLGLTHVMGLQNKGLYRANITVKLANPPSGEGTFTRAFETFKDINLTMTRHTTLLVDSWTAKTPEQVEERIDQSIIFPGKLLAPAAPLVNLAVKIVESPACCTQGPKLGKLDFWRDRVPADRLK